MIPVIQYDPNGSPLWVEIDTLGLYAISYSYSLLAGDAEPATTPRILTNPAVAGDNSDGVGKYYFPVVNNYQPGEALANYSGRSVVVNFHVQKLVNDDGFTLKATLLQGVNAHTATSLGGDVNDHTKNTLGAANTYTDIILQFQLKNK